MSYRTCGGGGYNPPEERDPQLVLRDVRDGKVSPTRAQDVYKVAIDTATPMGSGSSCRSTWTVDAGETAKLRGSNAVKL